MLAVQAWGRALAAVLLLCGVVELLLPPGGAKGYARSFLGLLVLLSVLQPVVGLLRGQIHLALPPASSAGAPGPTAAAAGTQAFESLVAAGAARTASAVPGVQAATASVRFGPAPAGSAEPAAPVGASVAVTPAPGAPPGLEAAVRAAVAADLGTDAAAVTVSVT